jgi:hypothetical protein
MSTFKLKVVAAAAENDESVYVVHASVDYFSINERFPRRTSTKFELPSNNRRETKELSLDSNVSYKQSKDKILLFRSG